MLSSHLGHPLLFPCAGSILASLQMTSILMWSFLVLHLAHLSIWFCRRPYVVCLAECNTSSVLRCRPTSFCNIILPISIVLCCSLLVMLVTFSCWFPRFLQSSCFFVSSLFGHFLSFILTMWPAHNLTRLFTILPTGKASISIIKLFGTCIDSTNSMPISISINIVCASVLMKIQF